MRLTLYTLGWVLWALLFVVLETMAVLDKGRGDTLSEHVWWLTEPWPVRFAAGGLMFWAVLHFLTRRV